MFEGFDETRVEVGDGVALHVTAGAGTPVRAAARLPAERRCAGTASAPALAERHAVVVPDLRGYGRSSTPPDDADHTVYSKRHDGGRHRRRDGVARPRPLRRRRPRPRRAGRLPDWPSTTPTASIGCARSTSCPTIEQFELLASSRRAAVFGFHWYFLAVPPPLPEALIGAEPALYLEQVMGRWAGSVPGADAITPEAMAAYVARLHAGGHRRVVRRLPRRRHLRRRPRRRRPRRRPHDRLPGARAVGRPPQRRRQRRVPRHVAALDGRRPAGDRAAAALRPLHPRGAAGRPARGAARVPRLNAFHQGA